MIWHIVKKDLRLLWPLVLIIAAIHALNATMWFMLGNFIEPQGLQRIAGIFIIVVVLGTVSLIATAVHQDPLAGDRQDWLVRPMRRRDLLLAKLLFVLIAIHGPVLLIDMAQCLFTGFPFQEALTAVLSRNLYLLLCVSLPMLAIAALTSSIIEVIGAILAISIAMVVVLTVVQATTPIPGMTFATLRAGWLMLELLQLAALATAFVVIGLQYFRRATLPARAVAIGAVLTFVPLSAFVPWSSAFAFEQWLSADPARAKSAAISFDPSIGKFAVPPGGSSRPNSVWLPLRISGFAPKSVLLKDRADLRIIGRDGTVLFSGLTVGDPQAPLAANATLLSINDFPVQTIASGDVRTHQLIILPRKILDIVRNQPVRLEIDYSLTLFQAATSATIPAVNGEKWIERFGYCKTKTTENSDQVRLGCLGAGDPVFCATLVVENAAGEQQGMSRPCDRNYLPYNAHFAPRAANIFMNNVALQGPRYAANRPQDASRLANAQLTLTSYNPAARFTHQLVIPEIRLGDWEVDDAGASL